MISFKTRCLPEIISGDKIFYRNGVFAYNTCSIISKIKLRLPKIFCFEKEYLKYAESCENEFIVLKRKFNKKEYAIYFIDSRCSETLVIKGFLELSK